MTVGVADLERSLAFYRDGLGLPTEGIVGREFEHGAVAFFTLSGGLKLGLRTQDDIAHDTGLPKAPISPTAFTIGHNVVRHEEVDEVMEQAARWSRDRETCSGYILWQIGQIFPRPGRPPLGGGLESRQPSNL